jgi:TatD DNase family protein
MMEITGPKPLFVDSHAHINMPEFDSDRDDVIRRAFADGVAAILCPAEITEPDQLDTALRLAHSHPPIALAAGVHPHAAKHFGKKEEAETIKKLASQGRIAAVGEIGLDFHYNFSTREEQLEAFRAQLHTAEEIGLPVIIHSRLAAADVWDCVRDTGFNRGGVLHCYTEDWDFASRMLDRGFFISFSGILTFPKAQDLREVAKKVPEDRLLAETDSPYLTPVPFRGRVKRNEPRYVRYTIEALAALKGHSFDEMAALTTNSYRRCFHLK